MPTPALDTVQLLDANGVTPHNFPSYEGHWVVHLPAITSPPGDGLINELDFAIPFPGRPGVILGFYIGNDSDGDPSRFASDQVLDSTAMPSWVTYFGVEIVSPGWWGASPIATWDGGWNDNPITPTTSVTLDSTNSDPGWTGFATAIYIDSFTPASGSAGDTITITGVGFTGASGLQGPPIASFTVDSDTQITAVLAGGATASSPFKFFGADTLVYDSLEWFDFVGSSITSVTPSHGTLGDVITITGSDLASASHVACGLQWIVPDSVSSTTVTFTIPPTTAVGTNSAYLALDSDTFLVWFPGNNFTVDAPPTPTITGVSPARAPASTTVTVTGTHFTGATDFTFDGASIAYTVVDDSHITFVVPAAPRGGYTIVVTTPYGTPSDSSFFLTTPPVITSYDPLQGSALTRVNLTGDNFLIVTESRVGSLPPTSGGIISDAQMVVFPGGTGDIGYYGDLAPAADLVTGVSIDSPDGSAGVSPYTLFPAIFADLESRTDFDFTFPVAPHFCRIDDTRWLAFAYAGDPDYRVAIVDMTDPAAPVVGASVEALDFGLSVPDPAFADVSPDGTLAVVLAFRSEEGIFGQVFALSGTTVTPLWHNIYASAPQPGGYGVAVMTNERFLSFTGSDLSFWSYSSSGIGSLIWDGVASPGWEWSGDSSENSKPWRIDDTHIGYIAPGTGDLTLASVTDSGFTVIASVACSVFVRQETGRPGWFRGYDVDTDNHHLHVYEFHLDPSAGTATGGLLTTLDSPAILGAVGFAPLFDVDGHDADLNTTDQLILGIGEDLGSDETNFVYALEFTRGFVHLARAPVDLNVGLVLRAFIPCGHDRFAAATTAGELGVYRLRIANHAPPVGVWSIGRVRAS